MNRKLQAVHLTVHNVKTVTSWQRIENNSATQTIYVITSLGPTGLFRS